MPKRISHDLSLKNYRKLKPVIDIHLFHIHLVIA